MSTKTDMQSVPKKPPFIVCVSELPSDTTDMEIEELFEEEGINIVSMVLNEKVCHLHLKKRGDLFGALLLADGSPTIRGTVVKIKMVTDLSNDDDKKTVDTNSETTNSNLHDTKDTIVSASIEDPTNFCLMSEKQEIPLEIEKISNEILLEIESNKTGLDTIVSAVDNENDKKTVDTNSKIENNNLNDTKDSIVSAAIEDQTKSCLMPDKEGISLENKTENSPIESKISVLPTNQEDKTMVDVNALILSLKAKKSLITNDQTSDEKEENVNQSLENLNNEKDVVWLEVSNEDDEKTDENQETVNISKIEENVLPTIESNKGLNNNESSVFIEKLSPIDIDEFASRLGFTKQKEPSIDIEKKENPNTVVKQLPRNMPRYPPYKIEISNLPSNTTENDVRNLFTGQNIVSVRPNDNDFIVDFKQLTGLKAALQMYEPKINDSIVSIELVTKKPKQDSTNDRCKSNNDDQTKVSKPPPPPSMSGAAATFDRKIPSYPPYKACISNLPLNTAEEDVRRIFPEQNIISIILRHEICQIEFKNRAALCDALNMKDVKIGESFVFICLPNSNAAVVKSSINEDEKSKKSPNDVKTINLNSNEVNRSQQKSAVIPKNESAVKPVKIADTQSFPKPQIMETHRRNIPQNGPFNVCICDLPNRTTEEECRHLFRPGCIFAISIRNNVCTIQFKHRAALVHALELSEPTIKNTPVWICLPSERGRPRNNSLPPSRNEILTNQEKPGVSTCEQNTKEEINRNGSRPAVTPSKIDALPNVPKYPPFQLKMTNLPSTTTESDIQQALNAYHVINVKLNTSFAIVQLKSRANLIGALEMEYVTIKSVKVKIDLPTSNNSNDEKNKQEIDKQKLVDEKISEKLNVIAGNQQSMNNLPNENNNNVETNLKIGNKSYGNNERLPFSLEIIDLPPFTSDAEIRKEFSSLNIVSIQLNEYSCIVQFKTNEDLQKAYDIGSICIRDFKIIINRPDKTKPQPIVSFQQQNPSSQLPSSIQMHIPPPSLLNMNVTPPSLLTMHIPPPKEFLERQQQQQQRTAQILDQIQFQNQLEKSQANEKPIRNESQISSDSNKSSSGNNSINESPTKKPHQQLPEIPSVPPYRIFLENLTDNTTIDDIRKALKSFNGFTVEINSDCNSIIRFNQRNDLLNALEMEHIGIHGRPIFMHLPTEDNIKKFYAVVQSDASLEKANRCKDLESQMRSEGKPHKEPIPNKQNENSQQSKNRELYKSNTNNQSNTLHSQQQKDFHSSTQSLQTTVNSNQQQKNNKMSQRKNFHNSTQSLCSPNETTARNKNPQNNNDQRNQQVKRSSETLQRKDFHGSTKSLTSSNHRKDFHNSTQSLTAQANDTQKNNNSRNPFRRLSTQEQPLNEDKICELPSSVNKGLRNRTESKDRSSGLNLRNSSVDRKSNQSHSLQRNNQHHGSTRSLHDKESLPKQQISTPLHQRNNDRNEFNKINSNDRGRCRQRRAVDSDDDDDNTILMRPKSVKLLLKHMPIDRSDREITNLCKGLGNVVNSLKIFRDRRNRCVYVTLESEAEAELTIRGINRSNMGIVVERATEQVRGRQDNRNTGQILNKFAKDGPCILCKVVTTKKCRRCGAFYCSRKCQEIDWPKHCIQCIQMPGLG